MGGMGWARDGIRGMGRVRGMGGHIDFCSFGGMGGAWEGQGGQGKVRGRGRERN